MRHRAYIWPRPGKDIGFGKDDPRAVIVKAKTALGIGRNLDGVGRLARRRMGHRQDDDNRLAVTVGVGHNNGNWAVFHALLTASLMVVGPEIRIADDHAGNRRRDIHGLRARFRIVLVIEGGSLGRRFSCADGLHQFGG